MCRNLHTEDSLIRSQPTAVQKPSVNQISAFSAAVLRELRDSRFVTGGSQILDAEITENFRGGCGVIFSVVLRNTMSDAGRCARKSHESFFLQVRHII
jgi:hypothetical protein